MVSRVRLRWTMCVPPCEAGVKPIPPKPVSRPECIRISPISAAESRTWMTARMAVTASPGYRTAAPAEPARPPWSASQASALGLFPGGLDDRVDQLGRDPVLRDVARHAGLAR